MAIFGMNKLCILFILVLFAYGEANNFSLEVDNLAVQLKEATFADFDGLSPGFTASDNYTFVYYPEFAQYETESQLFDALKVKNPELFKAVDYQNRMLKNITRMMEPGAGDFLEKVREKFMILMLKEGSRPNQAQSKKIFVDLVNEYKQLCVRSKKALEEAFPNITHFLTENKEVQIFVQFLINFLPFFESGDVSSFRQICNLCPNKCPGADLPLD